MKRRNLRITENHVSKDDSEATNCRVNQSQEFKVGDITWAMLHNCTWWPAQLVDEESVSAIAKPKKKVDGEALVRLYGTYEYLYVDTVTGSSEFEKSLKENFSVKEAFQKALEEDISHMKSGRLLERNTFEENATCKASNNRKPKEDGITRNWEGDCVNSQSEAGSSLEKSEKGPTQTKETKKKRNDDSEDKKQKGDMGRNPEVAIKTMDRASDDKKLKQIEVRRPLGTEKSEVRRPTLTREAKRKVDYSSTNKKSKEDLGGNQQVAVEAKGEGASRGKKLKQEEAIKPMETKKFENTGQQTRKSVRNRDNASRDQKSNEDLGGNQLDPITARHNASIDKKLQQDEMGKIRTDRVDASNGVCTRKEKVAGKCGNEIKVKKWKGGDEAFETGEQPHNEIGKSEQENLSKYLKAYSPCSAKCDAKERSPDVVCTRNDKVTNKGGNEIKIKNLKGKNEASETGKQRQHGLGKSEQETVSEHLISYSPGSEKCDAKEKPPDSSARRMKMMQSLGLIAPSGSPFVRKGFTKAAFL